MRRLAGLLFYSSFFIALCAAALGAATFALLQLEADWRLTGFIFCGTWFVYNSHALYPGRALPEFRASERRNWVRRNRNLLLVLSFLALAGCVALLTVSDYLFFAWLAHLVTIAVAYTIPVIPYKNNWLNLRSIPLLKVLLIAYVWASVTVQLPLLHNGVSLADSYSYYLLYGRFLFILALAPLFDIRDVDRDAADRVITLPNLIGLRSAKLVSVILLMIFSVLSVWHYPVNFAVALLISAAAAIFVVVSAKPGRSELFYSGWADGMMLLQALLIFTAAIIP